MKPAAEEKRRWNEVRDGGLSITVYDSGASFCAAVNPAAVKFCGMATVGSNGPAAPAITYVPAPLFSADRDHKSSCLTEPPNLRLWAPRMRVTVSCTLTFPSIFWTPPHISPTRSPPATTGLYFTSA